MYGSFHLHKDLALGFTNWAFSSRIKEYSASREGHWLLSEDIIVALTGVYTIALTGAYTIAFTDAFINDNET